MSVKALQKLVHRQYGQRLDTRDSWGDWLYENHVPWVADRTAQLCEQYGGDEEIAVAAALVHDIADSVISRFDDQHEAKSLHIGRQLCEQSGYSPEQVSIIIDDICARHSCRNGIVPESLAGKIMATADACFHFQTDFYLYAFYHTDRQKLTYEDRRKWMVDKIEKDFHQKIFFDEVREQVKPVYEALRLIIK